MEDHIARRRNVVGGEANPINVDKLVEETDNEEEDEEESVDTDQSVGDEVEPEEVMHEVVYVGDHAPHLIPVGPVEQVVGPLVEIEDLEYEDMPPLQPQERDLPDPPAPPYVP